MVSGSGGQGCAQASWQPGAQASAPHASAGGSEGVHGMHNKVTQDQVPMHSGTQGGAPWHASAQMPQPSSGQPMGTAEPPASASVPQASSVPMETGPTLEAMPEDLRVRSLWVLKKTEEQVSMTEEALANGLKH